MAHGWLVVRTDGYMCTFSLPCFWLYLWILTREVSRKGRVSQCHQQADADAEAEAEPWTPCPASYAVMSFKTAASSRVTEGHDAMFLTNATASGAIVRALAMTTAAFALSTRLLSFVQC